MKKELRIKRHKKIRKKVFGASDKPRLAVYRSSQHIYAQIIDDNIGKTIVSASDSGENGTKMEKAFKVGKKLAEKALKHKVSMIVFDRGGFPYKGRVSRLAEGVREGGLKF